MDQGQIHKRAFGDQHRRQPAILGEKMKDGHLRVTNGVTGAAPIFSQKLPEGVLIDQLTDKSAGRVTPLQQIHIYASCLS
jgi:hypothetical protein